MRCDFEAVDGFYVAAHLAADDDLAGEDIALDPARIQQDHGVLALDNPFHLAFDTDGARAGKGSIHLRSRPQNSYHFIFVIDACFSRFKHN